MKCVKSINSIGKCVALIGCLLQISTAQAQIKAHQQDPYSIHIFPNEGLFVFYATITEGTQQACSGANRWSISTTKPGANELTSMILTARVAGKKITVIGPGTCNPDGYGLQISYVYFDN